jgi:phosphoribosylglycinamide formyltransferase-1
MKNIAIFASGSGTNAENIIRRFANSETIKTVVVLSDNPKAGVHERVNGLGTPSFVFTRGEFNEATPVIETLAEYKVEFIVLAGFLSKISAPLLRAFPRRIINIHPALLPKFGGKGMYGMHVHEAVVAAGEKESGITIHYINERYDEGAIIFQTSCPLSDSDTAQDLASRIHVLEHTYYPLVIEELLSPLQH